MYICFLDRNVLPRAAKSKAAENRAVEKRDSKLSATRKKKAERKRLGDLAKKKKKDDKKKKKHVTVVGRLLKFVARTLIEFVRERGFLRSILISVSV
jgi:hypothetical protein